MRGKVIYCNKKAAFVQIDKNNQICSLYDFDKKKEFKDRIGERILPQVMNVFRGRPLYTNWADLIEAVRAAMGEEAENEEA